MKKTTIILIASALTALGCIEMCAKPQTAKTSTTTATTVKKTAVREIGEKEFSTLIADFNSKDWKFLGKRPAIVDFSATWCGPCRQEMPNLVANYEKYHDKGFEIVGVSFDQKKEAWVEGIQKLGMKWPQISDLKGWKCAASEVYGVASIPSNILVDPNGIIVAMDLRGEKVGEKLKEIYGE